MIRWFVVSAVAAFTVVTNAADVRQASVRGFVAEPVLPRGAAVADCDSEEVRLGPCSAEFSLLSLNIHHGVAADGSVGLGAAERSIREAGADFVGLQDVDWHAHRSGRDDQAVELGCRCGYHATFAKATFIGGTPEQQHGVALLSHEKPLSKHCEFLPGKERRVVLFCEFADCYVGVTEFDADPAARDESAKIVAKIAATLGERKPVHLVDDCGGLAPYASAMKRVVIREPVLDVPAVIPQPASLTISAGLYSLGAMEPTLAHVARKVDRSVPAEGYRLIIGRNGIALIASDDAGAFYALQTLKQLAVPRWGRLYFPCCTVDDAPRFSWRGMMIDDARHFFGKAAMRRTLDLLAFHKMNVLHWHLTDSEGWRIPITGHPEFVEKGAFREHSKDHGTLADRFEDGIYGPFSYSVDDLREIAAYAKARHVRIVPEVDLPGHCEAAIRAFPELCCFQPESKDAPKGAVRNVFCLGDDRSLALFDDVIDSLCELFPESEYIHIGGDEVNKVNWKSCPKCQARIRSFGLKDEEGLQSWLTLRLTDRLAKHGRKVVGWDEIILNGVAPKNATIMSWRGAEGGIAAAKAGRTCVIAPHLYCYFNYEQGLRSDPVIYPWWSHPITLKKAYAFDPFDGIPESARMCVLGGQCCLWANLIVDEMQLQWQAWPRACANAEVLWTPLARRDYVDFRRRIAVHRSRLIDRHVNCASLED